MPFFIRVIVITCTPDENGDFPEPLLQGILAAVGIFVVSTASITISQNAWHVGTRCARLVDYTVLSSAHSIQRSICSSFCNPL